MVLLFYGNRWPDQYENIIDHTGPKYIYIYIYIILNFNDQKYNLILKKKRKKRENLVIHFQISTTLKILDPNYF